MIITPHGAQQTPLQVGGGLSGSVTFDSCAFCFCLLLMLMLMQH
jgi:hypothetical protein